MNRQLLISNFWAGLEPSIESYSKQIDSLLSTLTDEQLQAFVDGQLYDSIHCRRCGTGLNEDDRCCDLTCPFSDHSQACPAGWSGHPERKSGECSCSTTLKEKPLKVWLVLALQKIIAAKDEEDYEKQRDQIVQDLEKDDWSVNVDSEETDD